MKDTDKNKNIKNNKVKTVLRVLLSVHLCVPYLIITK